MVTQNSANNKTEASGKVLQGQGVGTASDFSTATYPSTATGTGTILRADGTNVVATTATYPTTTTVNRVLYSSANNVIGDIATANNGVMIASNTGVPSMLAAGTINQVLTANTAAPPSWQNARGYAINMASIQGDPADSTTYYMAQGVGFIAVTTNLGSTRMYIPEAGKITAVYGVITNGGTLGSGESVTVNLRLNDTTNTAITSSLVTNTTSNTFNNTSISITVAAGDYVAFTVVTPAWATNPTQLRFGAVVYVE